jgi:hypothetical protein
VPALLARLPVAVTTAAAVTAAAAPSHTGAFGVGTAGIAFALGVSVVLGFRTFPTGASSPGVHLRILVPFSIVSVQ